MTPIVLIVLVIRALAIGQVLLIALVIARGAAPVRLRMATGALLLCVCAYLTLQTPMFRLLDGPGWPLITLGAQLVPLALWVFAHMLFERRIDWRIGAGAGVIIVLCWAAVVAAVYAGAPSNDGRFVIPIMLQRGFDLLLLGHAMLIALAERGDDLIEKRRRLRVGFVSIVAVLAVMVILFEFAFGFDRMPQPAVLVQAIAILGATFALGAALLKSDADILFDPKTQLLPSEPSLSPADHVLKQKLDAAIASGVYRDIGLTIGQLADRLGVPEHRLRALINQRLGYRNFSAFLNHHRIGEAKAMLADPAHVSLPILTIAMDLGYGSLAPFNRAFRDVVGQPPSEFRRAAILPP